MWKSSGCVAVFSVFADVVFCFMAGIASVLCSSKIFVHASDETRVNQDLQDTEILGLSGRRVNDVAKCKRKQRAKQEARADLWDAHQYTTRDGTVLAI